MRAMALDFIISNFHTVCHGLGSRNPIVRKPQTRIAKPYAHSELGAFGLGLGYVRTDSTVCLVGFGWGRLGRVRFGGNEVVW